MPARKLSLNRSRRARFELLEPREVLSTTLAGGALLEGVGQLSSGEPVAVVSGLAASVQPHLAIAPDGNVFVPAQKRSFEPFEPTLMPFGPNPTTLPVPATPPILSVDSRWGTRSVKIRIQGDGFFVVEGRNGQTLLSKGGDLHLNDDQQLIARGGLRVLGYPVDDDYQVDPSHIAPLEIPLGRSLAQATHNVTLAGNLTPGAEIGTTGQIIESQVLTDGVFAEPGPSSEFGGSGLTAGSLLANLTILDGTNYHQPFLNGGRLTFTGHRGGRLLAETQLGITNTTSVQDLLDFLTQSLGIHERSSQEEPPLPGGAGVTIEDGKIRITSDPGIENENSISLSALRFQQTGSSLAEVIPLNFRTIQQANGEGATADAVVFDSLGAPLHIRVTTVVENKSAEGTAYRWYAYSPDNEPAVGVDTAIGNGVLVFDSAGQLLSAGGQVIEIARERSAAQSPLEIALDFTKVTGFAALGHLGNPVSTLNVSRQDGFPPGVLDRFIVDGDGLIRGVFTNGLAKPLGQLLLAAVPKSHELRRIAHGLYSETVRSGPTTIGRPGKGELGTLVNGPVSYRPNDHAPGGREHIRDRLLRHFHRSTAQRVNDRMTTSTSPLIDSLFSRLFPAANQRGLKKGE